MSFWLVLGLSLLPGLGNLFTAGGLAYAEMLLERFSGSSNGGGSGMWMIYVAVAVDLSSDGLMLGSGSAVVRFSRSCWRRASSWPIFPDTRSSPTFERTMMSTPAFAGGFALFTLGSAGLETVLGSGSSPGSGQGSSQSQGTSANAPSR